MKRFYHPPCPLQCPPGEDGWSTVFHYPEYQFQPYWPWLYETDGHTKRPASWDNSKEANDERIEEAGGVK